MSKYKASKMQNASKQDHSEYRKNNPKRALESWETKSANCEVTPQAIWPIAKSLTKRGEPKAPSAIHSLLAICRIQTDVVWKED
jgi:hypothetical protein